MAIPYAAAVLSEDCEALVRRLVVACQMTTASVDDPRDRASVISAALMTTAQILDGNDMPRESGTIRRDGVTESLALLVLQKKIAE